MPFVVPSFTKIRDDLLRDIKNLNPEAHIAEDSDFYIRASSVASCVEGLYQYQSWICKQIFPDTADTEYLELHCALRNIYRKLAIYATGTAVITGETGATVQSGSIIRTKSGEAFESIGVATIGDAGTSNIIIRSLQSGIAGNHQGLSGVFVQTPNGIDSNVTVITTCGGTDSESDEELLDRLLELIRRPPAGGNKYDYKRWAMEVEGVTGAYVYPLRRGLGTVDTVIIAGGGLPSEDTIIKTKNHIDNVRPVTAKSTLVLAPEVKEVDITIDVHLNGITLNQFEINYRDALTTFFATIEPGKSIVRSQLEALASNIIGVVDRQLHEPISNVEASVNKNVVEWLRLGELTISEMR